MAPDLREPVAKGNGGKAFFNITNDTGREFRLIHLHTTLPKNLNTGLLACVKNFGKLMISQPLLQH